MKCLTFSLLAAATLAGCVGPAKTVTYQPAHGQAVSAAETDALACERATEGQEDRRIRFAACMMARDYRTSVQLGSLAGLFGEPMVYATTARTGQQSADAMARDLRTCQQAARVTVTERVRFVLIGPFFESGEQMSDRFRTCLEPLGYQVLPWEGYTN